MKTRLIALTASLCLAAPLAVSTLQAQARRDLSATVLFGATGHYRIDWGSGRVTTLQRIAMNSVHTRHDNGGSILGGGVSGPIYSTVFLSALTTLTTISGPAAAFAPDQDGHYWIANGGGNVARLVGNIAPIRYVISQGRNVNAVCRDGDTGDVVVGCADGTVLHLTRVGWNERVIARGLGVISSIAWLPDTGHYLVGRYDPSAGLLIIDRNGTIVRRISLADVGAVTVDDVQRRFFAATRNGVIGQFDLSGRAILTRSFGSSMNFSGLDVYADNPLQVTTTGVPGSTANVTLRMGWSRGASYALALSLSPRPGLRFGPQNWLNMAGDALFYTTLGRGLAGSTGFTGTLHPFTATASATLRLPSDLPPVTFYLGGGAVNSLFPGNVEVTNVVPIQMY